MRPSLASSLRYRHSRRMGVIASNRGIDGSCGVREPSGNEGEIAPMDGALLEGRLQMVESDGGLRDDEESGGVAVNSVHDPPPVLGAEVGDLGDAGQQSVRKRSTRTTRPGVNDHSCGFVDNDHIAVLIRDAELDLDVRYNRNFLDDEIDLNHLTRCYAIRRRQTVSSQPYATCFDR